MAPGQLNKDLNLLQRLVFRVSEFVRVLVLEVGNPGGELTRAAEVLQLASHSEELAMKGEWELAY